MLVVAHIGLLATFDLASHPVATMLWFGLGVAGLVLSDRRGRRPAFPAARILLLAGLLRALLLPLPPSLSDDLLRYEWDGRVAASGLNPYRLAPAAEELRPLRDELWRRLPHRQVPTVYPPLSLALFTAGTRLPWPQMAIKAALSVIDLVSCWLLLALCRRLELPATRAIWYAWNPLVTLEVAGMGHVDALGVAAILATVLLLLARPPRAGTAALGAAAGVLAKLVPLLALPAWSLISGRPVRFWLVAAGAVGAGLLPVLIATGGVPPGLVTYGVSWEFNGPLFEPLWRLFASLEVSRGISFGLDRLKDLTGWHTTWNRVYPFVYPQLLAKAVLGLGLLVAALRACRGPHAVTATGRVFGAALLCSATVYPWYLLWVLPWAALCRHRAWLALSGLLLLSYLPQMIGVALWPWIHLAVWMPFLALLAWRAAWSID